MKLLMPVRRTAGAIREESHGQPGCALRDHGRRRREAEGLLLRPLRLEDRLEQPDELRDGRDRRRGGINGGVGDGENWSGTRVYIAVPDLQEALDKIEAAGGKTVMPPQELPMVTLALFEDPEGNTVGLVKG